MNIADTSNNGTVIEPLNSANSPTSEQGNCPFYSILHDENMAVTNLPLLNPAADVDEEQQHCEYPATNDVKDDTRKDWVAEPDSDKQALIDSEFQKLLTLNQELQTANNSLYAQVEQLKQELAEAEKILQWQKKRSSVTDSMLNQQAQELAASQDQIQSLFQQLETAVQTVQNQEMFIETHKSQLQISQERVAQLERECTLLQTKYSEQSQQLLHSENTCRELRTRLIRQQRQTLQFKAALEKCLDTTVPHYDTLDDTAHHPHDVTSKNTRFSRKARSLFPNAQPIKPWSAETDAPVDSCSNVSLPVDNTWIEPPTSSTYTTNYSAYISEIDEKLAAVDERSTPKLETDESIDEVGDTSSVQGSNLDRQLESLIEMFFAPHPTSSNSSSVNHPNTNSVDGSMRETLLSHSELEETSEAIADQPLLTNTYVSPQPGFTVSSSNESPINAGASETKTRTPEIQPDNQDYWAELPIDPIDDFTLQPLGEYHLDHQSPSPLIYPQRPPKGRKSFASVELPNFRPKSRSQGSNE